MDAGPASVGILERTEPERSEVPAAAPPIASPRHEVPIGHDSPILAITLTARATCQPAPDPSQSPSRGRREVSAERRTNA